MAFTLYNFFKFDLAALRRKGYKVGTISALYEGSEPAVFGNSLLWYARLMLTFQAKRNDPTKGSLGVSGIINGYSINTAIDMVQVASNLGTSGGQWYFVCPITKKLCRTLYFNGEGLVSRQALKGIHYRCQVRNKFSRPFWKLADPEIAYKIMNRDWFNKPRAKKHYKGKPTRMMQRYDKVRSKLVNAYIARSVRELEVEMAFDAMVASGEGEVRGVF